MHQQLPQEHLRTSRLQDWASGVLANLYGKQAASRAAPMSALSGDASFRRYFRVNCQGKNHTAVDAPPQHEDSETFVRVARLMSAAGLRVPEVYAADFSQGFMLLEDFGDEVLLHTLLQTQEAGEPAKAQRLYTTAIDSLVMLQDRADKLALDPYDRQQLRQEMALFPEWFCTGLLKMRLSATERDLIHEAMTFLEDAALSQPTVAVHRDYHSRNLMLLSDGAAPGVIDFQDARCGPYTYDLVSLLRDCYISWPDEWIAEWTLYYLERIQERGLLTGITMPRLVRDFDLMGLQRHLKVLGIFSRLYLRDNRSGYLADIPLVIEYFLEISGRHSELSALRDWFRVSVLPRAEKQLLVGQGDRFIPCKP